MMIDPETLSKEDLSSEEIIQLNNYYNLSEKDKERIGKMHRQDGMTVDEIARRFNITAPDVQRILSPPKDYGKYTAEEKFRHWMAGLKRARTLKQRRDKK